MIRVGTVPVILAAVSLCACTLVAAEAPDPSRFEATVIAKGADSMTRPMVMQVAPDGLIYIIELGGKLKTVRPESGAVRTIGELDVFAEKETGLIGLVLDPNFAVTQHLYLHYAPKEGTNARVSRFALVDGLLDPASEKVLLEFGEQRRECCHHAGSMAFDGAGNLCISTGDNTHPNYSGGFAPTDERPGREPFDAQKSSSNTADLRGKILRITPKPDGSYDIPKGNLFGPTGRFPKIKGHPAIYVMGCRNPWRISVDKETGILYFGDVGPDAGRDNKDRGPRGHDEINQVRQAGNYGWPYFIADNKPYRRYDFTTKVALEWHDVARPVNVSPSNTGSAILPPAEPAWIYYPYGAAPDFPVIPNRGGRTACAGPVYRYDAAQSWPYRLPEYYHNCLLFHDWNRNFMMAVFLDEQSNQQRMELFLNRLSFKRPIDLKFGPNGELYVLDYGSTWGVNEDVRLVRVDYFSDNRPPTTHVEVMSEPRGAVPLEVRLSGAGSADRDGDALRYEWRLNPGGDVVSTAVEPTLTFNTPGIYQAQLTVTDTAGAARSETVTVYAGNAVPELAFEYPQSGFYDPAQTKTVRYRLSLSDHEDGDQRGKILFRRIQRDGPGTIAQPHPGLVAVRASDCLNCHAVDRKVVGPAFAEIAERYRDQKDAAPEIARRVINGSTGIWGQIPMLPHPQHTPVEAGKMVDWILGLGDDVGAEYLAAGDAYDFELTGDVPPTIELRAEYTDRPVPPLPANTVSTTVILRPYAVEAETYTALKGAQLLQPDKDPFLGAISNHGYALYPSVNLEGIKSVTCRVAAPNGGTRVELRTGSVTGPLIATVPIPRTGAWTTWAEPQAPLSQDVTGVHDLYVVFRNDKTKAHLMNLDWIRFAR